MSKTITVWGKMCKTQMIMKNISLGELAEATGLSRNYVSAIINGRIIVPDETRKKISDKLDVSLT